MVQEHDQQKENEAQEKAALAQSLTELENKNMELKAEIEQILADKESTAQELNQQKENEAQENTALAQSLTELESKNMELKA